MGPSIPPLDTTKKTLKTETLKIKEGDSHKSPAPISGTKKEEEEEEHQKEDSFGRKSFVVLLFKHYCRENRPKQEEVRKIKE